jgi:hypothetical protein
MKLHRASEVPVDTHELICRESRLAGVIRFFFFGIVLLAPIVYGWQVGYQWLMWLFTILFTIVIPLMLKDVIGQFGETNWVVRIRSNGVWINLKSYRDKVSEGASVVWLDYREIASAGRHNESYSTPSVGTGSPRPGTDVRDTIWHDVFLELRLIDDQTGELQATLSNLRSEAVARQRPGGQSLFRHEHFPVWLVEPAVIRIIWSTAHRVVVAPRVSQAIAQLETYVPLVEPTQRKRPNWRKLTPPEVDELARELVHVHGAYSEAIALLLRIGGLTEAEAMTLVQRFEEEVPR